MRDERLSSLGAMLQKDLKNEVPEEVLALLPAEDRVLIENVLLVAQAELEILNLASTTAVVSESGVRVSCALAGPGPVVTLGNMRCVQNYSPARVREVRVALQENRLILVIEVHHAHTRVTASEIEVVRLTKVRRLF